MKTMIGRSGTTLSYTVAGAGAPLVLVHGGFSDHDTNWAFVTPLLQQHFTVHAIARRGRGLTDATEGHSLEDEGRDVADVVRAIGTPVSLLGHSYGGHCALIAASLEPQLVKRLVVYEPARAELIPADALAALEALAAAEAWDPFAYAFFANLLKVPTEELDALRASELWPPIVADAPASLHDVRAMHAYRFDAARFSSLHMPVVLQVGSESPRHFYVTDDLVGTLPHVHVQTLAGQAHEGMTTAPELYVEKTLEFLLPEFSLEKTL